MQGNLIDALNNTDWVTFLGRFHPVTIHLPIGILCVALLFELWGIIFRKKNRHSALSFLLGVGTLTAIVAVILGWLLALDADSYPTATLFWHRWLGVATAVLAFLSYVFVKIYVHTQSGFSKVSYRLLLVACNIVLVIGSHHGGSMTHGANYLTRYAPWNTQQTDDTTQSNTSAIYEVSEGQSKVVGKPPSNTKAEMSVQLATKPKTQEALTLEAMHFLDSYCVSCHGPDKEKGRLRLDIPERALGKGKSKALAIIPHDSSNSETIVRIRLDPEHDDKMPPPKKPQPTAEEMEQFVAWIDAGGPWPETGMQAALRAYAAQNPSKNKSSVSPQASQSPLSFSSAEQEFLRALIQEGVTVNYLDWEKPGLMISFQHIDKPITLQKIERLKPIASKIIWLDLGHTQLNKNTLKSISMFTQLQRLHLEKSNIESQSLAPLRALKHLNYLNLYDTPIDNKAVAILQDMPQLRKVFLWQTKINQQGINKLKSANPQLEIVD